MKGVGDELLVGSFLVMLRPPAQGEFWLWIRATWLAPLCTLADPTHQAVGNAAAQAQPLKPLWIPRLRASCAGESGIPSLNTPPLDLQPNFNPDPARVGKQLALSPPPLLEPLQFPVPTWALILGALPPRTAIYTSAE